MVGNMSSTQVQESQCELPSGFCSVYYCFVSTQICFLVSTQAYVSLDQCVHSLVYYIPVSEAGLNFTCDHYRKMEVCRVLKSSPCANCQAHGEGAVHYTVHTCAVHCDHQLASAAGVRALFGAVRTRALCPFLLFVASRSLVSGSTKR